jgi:hypothetical protein
MQSKGPTQRSSTPLEGPRITAAISFRRRSSLRDEPHQRREYVSGPALLQSCRGPRAGHAGSARPGPAGRFPTLRGCQRLAVCEAAAPITCKAPSSGTAWES